MERYAINIAERKHLRAQWLAVYGRCVYCNTPLDRKSATFDHVIPLSQGGSRSPKNLALACLVCNNKKGNMRLPEGSIAKIDAAIQSVLKSPRIRVFT